MHLDKLIETVAIPTGVTAKAERGTLSVKGPKGESSRLVGSKTVSVAVTAEGVVFTALNATRNDKRMLRTGKAHAKNMLRGAAEGHTYKLKICSGHFPMTVAVKDGTLEVKNFIGEKVPRVLKLKQGCTVKLNGTEIVVEAPSKELAGSQASDIELLTRRPGFDTRIFQDGIYIIEKDGRQV